MTKKHTLSLILLILTTFPLTTFAKDTPDPNIPKNQKIIAQIDPRVELMSVVFRLAGNREYSKCMSKTVSKAMDSYFADYKSHPAVKKAQSLRKQYGVSYDAVMSFAVHLKDIDSCELLLPIDPFPQTLDKRWKPNELKTFLPLLKQFVQDTNFHQFLDQNKDYYNKSLTALQTLVDEKINTSWYDNFFGSTKGIHFNLILSIPNGPSNYGCRIKLGHTMQVYSVLGAWSIDLFGYGPAYFTQSHADTIIHEFNHSFCNPLVDRHLDELEPFGKKMYPIQKKKMRSQAYGQWQTMMRESLVRACEVRHAHAIHGPDYAQQVCQNQIARGFLWTKELSDCLAQYEQHRDQYKTLDDFFPEIVGRLNQFAIDYDKSHQDKN